MSDHPVIIAVDPGPTESAWVCYNPHSGGIRAFAKVPNEYFAATLRGGLASNVTHLVIEKIESFGMAVGAEVFETVFWSGRFAEAAHPLAVDRVTRRAVKLHLCGSARAKDPNIRQALIDRYGNGKAESIGTKADPGPLYGISGDVWSALAVAVTWGDQHAGERVA